MIVIILIIIMIIITINNNNNCEPNIFIMFWTTQLKGYPSITLFKTCSPTTEYLNIIE